MTIDTVNINEMMQSIAFYSRMFEKSIKNSTFSKIKEYHISNGKIPLEAVFKPCDAEAVVWLGRPPSNQEFDYICQLPC